MKHSKHFATRNTKTVQTQPILGREADMTQNNAGGFSFKAGTWEQFKRFLILGSEGGAYYVGEKELTIANAQNSIACIKQDGAKAVQMILDVSEKGRAPKNDPAIFALALACTYGDQATKSAAYAAITKICRIGTHLFTFCETSTTCVAGAVVFVMVWRISTPRRIRTRWLFRWSSTVSAMAGLTGMLSGWLIHPPVRAVS